MKLPFHRIPPILKGVLVVCGILFVLQGVAGIFLLSHQLGQFDTLEQESLKIGLTHNAGHS